MTKEYLKRAVLLNDAIDKLKDKLSFYEGKKKDYKNTGKLVPDSYGIFGSKNDDLISDYVLIEVINKKIFELKKHIKEKEEEFSNL